MYSRFKLAAKYLRYYLMAANGRGHGVHSPFVYELVRNVLMDGTQYEWYGKIEGLRSRLLRDESVLPVEDMGAGSVGGAGMRREGDMQHDKVRLLQVMDIARRAAKPARLGRLLFRLASYYRPEVVVELGTSLGLSAAYLGAGMGGQGGQGVWTIEGSAAVAERARVNLSELGLTGAAVSTGNFDVVLEPLLEHIGPVELAFVDGNHRYEPTLRYFDLLMRHSARSAMLIFDDIHWSKEMERTWVQIKADPRVMLTVDLFFFGIVVKRDELKVKQDLMIRF